MPFELDQPEKSSYMETIHDQLSNLEVDNFNHRSFVPYDKLEQLFTREIVLELLQENGLKFYNVAETTSAVIDGGLRVFAILLAIRAVDNITHFSKADRSWGSPLDAKLPLAASNVESYIKAPLKRQAFLRAQWKFLSPIISPDQSLWEFDEQTILPFLSKKPLGKNGAFGEVATVLVGASNHRIPNVKTEASTLKNAQSW